MAIDQIREDRIKKLEKIKELGVDPYPATTKRDHTIVQAKEMIGQSVAIAGRIRSLRPHGKIAFADLHDESGRIQLFFSQAEISDDKFRFLDNLDIGDFIQIEGEIFTTQSGELTVKVATYQLLTKSLLSLPSSWYGLKDKEERYRRRYIDLILNPEVKDRFVKKSKFWNAMRIFMIEEGFLEVETQVLQDIPGGADARPFITHHNALNIDLYLRISLELPLKRLLVGGFEKVFEIGRIFRNEGIDDEHLQDYTQLEFYWAYADYNQLMDLIQNMYQKVIQETFGTLKIQWKGQEVDWSGDWSRIEYTQLLNDHWGVDIDSMSVDDLYDLAQKLNVQVEPNLGKGRLLDYIYKKTIRPGLIQPIFVINHPVEVEPLAKRIPHDPEKVQRMQILAMGSELGKGFSELNDPLDQRERFEEQMKLREAGDDEAQMMDEDFVEALEYGMPPAAGFGISERLFSMLVDQPVREMVFFPLMRPEGEVKNERPAAFIPESSTRKTSDFTRDQAYTLMTEMIQNTNLRKHGVAVEAIMRSLSHKLHAMHPELPADEFDEEEWAIVGLLHDADYELIDKDSAKHTLVTAAKLAPFGVSQRIINGIKAHHDGIKDSRDNYLERAVYAADELSGLITAVALVRPDKKLSSVAVDAVMKKFDQKGFAAGANREQIRACEKELGIPLEEFIAIALEAMQKISDELGL